MIREYTSTAATIEEAVQIGCDMLGVQRDDVCVEIIDYPKAKTFGLFGGCDAKVRVYIDDGEPEEVEVAPAPVEMKTEPVRSAPASEKKPEPVAQPVAEAATAEAEETVEETEAAEETAPVVIDESQLTEQGKVALEYLRAILKGMEIENCSIKILQIENGIQLNLSGEGIGGAIGRRGENLTALQYLVSLAANNNYDNYFRVAINIGNYRERREQVLENLAKKTASRSLKYNRNFALEAMNPYERRIIHTCVHEIEGVTSWSMGEDKDRHVVIGPIGVAEGTDGAPVNTGNNNRRGGYRGGGRGGYRGGNRGGYNNNRGGNRGGYRGGNRGGYNNNRGGYRSSSSTQQSTNTTPRRDAAGSLYGRIEVPKRESSED